MFPTPLQYFRTPVLSSYIYEKKPKLSQGLDGFFCWIQINFQVIRLRLETGVMKIGPFNDFFIR